MKVKVVYNNINDKELIKLVQLSTPFFVEFIDSATKNGKKEAYKIKSPFSARKEPFIVIYDEQDRFVTCLYSEERNAVQQFIDLYK